MSILKLKNPLTLNYQELKRNILGAEFPWYWHKQLLNEKFDDHEDNYELLFFLRKVVKDVYKNPVAGKDYLDAGFFTKQCIEIHRGY